MKIIILAGGMQSTINNGQEGIPKPMAELGGKPLLWHIMKHFSQYGFNEFIICDGYRVTLIKEYFLDFYIYESDITVNLADNTVKIHKKRTEDWKVTVVDTGLFSSTGQRVSLIQKYINEDTFLVTYGDCLSDMDIHELVSAHKKGGKIATMALAKPTGRNQLIPIDDQGRIHYESSGNNVNKNSWINADCFVFNKKVFEYLQGNYDLEKQLLASLSAKQQLETWRHEGYWSAIETKRDLIEAENLWNAGVAPWII